MALLRACKAAGDDLAAAEEILLQSLRQAAEWAGWPEDLLPPSPWPQAPPGTRFASALIEWCHRCPRRVVLFLDEIAELYGRHTEATGQKFFELTQGQPWLVNALAHEIIFEMGVTDIITRGQEEDAKERLIRARGSHLNFLAARLHEPRVKRVIEPIVTGTSPGLDVAFDDDVSYVHDLGLIRETRDMRIANPIYREVLLQVLRV